jgi:uncharacterized protein (TIGR04255 family)
MNNKPVPDRLTTKPLIEALVEVKWGSAAEPDQDYPILAGRLYERLQKEYPFIEHLVPQELPIPISMHLVRHRYRIRKDGWPLVQVGPGIVTFNETSNYNWENFRAQVEKVIGATFEAHPNREQLRVNNLLLRYINALEFDYLTGDVLTFLKENLKITMQIPESLFVEGDLGRNPSTFALQLGYSSQKPPGTIVVRFATGQKETKSALLWEINFPSTKQDVPKMPEGFSDWLKGAHELIDRWFFELVRGRLLESFV